MRVGTGGGPGGGVRERSEKKRTGGNNLGNVRDSAEKEGEKQSHSNVKVKSRRNLPNRNRKKTGTSKTQKNTKWGCRWSRGKRKGESHRVVSP